MQTVLEMVLEHSKHHEWPMQHPNSENNQNYTEWIKLNKKGKLKKNRKTDKITKKGGKY